MNNNPLEYSFKNGDNLYSLGCIPTRIREQVIFEESDLQNLFTTYLGKFMKNNFNDKYVFAKNIQDAIENNKYIFYVSYNYVGFSIQAVSLRNHSILKEA